MPFKRREQLLILVVLLCVGALAGDRLLISPLFRLWDGRARRTAELDRFIKHGSQLVEMESRLTERWRGMQEQSRSRETSATENEVLSAVNRWVPGGDLVVTSLKPSWKLDEENCRKLEIQVSANGKLASIIRFLYALEADPQPLKIEEFDLTARDNLGQMLTCDVRFTRLVLEDGKQ